MSEKHRLRVLYIDDEEDHLTGLKINCEDYWEVDGTLDPEEVMSGKIDVEKFDVVLVDLVFNVKNGKSPPLWVTPDPAGGEKFLRWMRVKHRSIPVVVISALVGMRTRRNYKTDYPEHLFFDKPLDFGTKTFRDTVETFVRKRTMQATV